MIFIQTDNEIFGFGDNEDGQLGIGDERENVASPTKVIHSLPFKIKQISNGLCHTLLVLGIIYITDANKRIH